MLYTDNKIGIKSGRAMFQPSAPVEINSADARKKGIKDDDLVMFYNDYGSES